VTDFYPIDVHYLDTETGERVVARDEFGSDDEDGTFFEFVWSEGNRACDCNRRQDFVRAKGLPEEPDDASVVCGRSRYKIERIVRVSDGVKVYADAE
jgi:hypothetical protein